MMKPNFYQLLFLIGAALIAFHHTTDAQNDERRRLDAKDIPAEGKSVKSFVPSDWKLKAEARGDLNNDNLPDAVLTVANDSSSALVVIFKNADGNFTRAAVAPDALYCDCGSVLGDGTPEVKIERGQIIFKGLSGSREAEDKTMRFRWETATKRFLLIGDDLETSDRVLGETQTISSNYLTNTRIVTESAPKKRAKKSQQKIKPQRVYLDELDYQKYWEAFEAERGDF